MNFAVTAVLRGVILEIAIFAEVTVVVGHYICIVGYIVPSV